jgi:hypothetical protein
MGTAFLVFAILDLLWSVYHGKGSKEIVERDVVAEAYIDPGATKFMLLQSYGHFCLCDALLFPSCICFALDFDSSTSQSESHHGQSDFRRQNHHRNVRRVLLIRTPTLRSFTFSIRYAGLREWFQIIVLDLPRLSLSFILLTSVSNPSQLSIVAAIFKVLFAIILLRHQETLM